VRHTILVIVEDEEGAGAVVVRVCFRAVGSVVAGSGQGAVRIEAVLLEVEDSAVAAADVQEGRMVVVGRTGLPAEAQRTAADPEVVGLSRVSPGISCCGVGLVCW
jgi:hypothetical protein